MPVATDGIVVAEEHVDMGAARRRAALGRVQHLVVGSGRSAKGALVRAEAGARHVVGRKPLVAIALAAALGFVVGTLVRRALVKEG